MKLIALSLLLGAAVVYVIARANEDNGAAWGYIRAFSEAGSAPAGLTAGTSFAPAPLARLPARDSDGAMIAFSTLAEPQTGQVIRSRLTWRS